MPSARAHLGGLELLTADQATTKGFINGLNLQFWRKLTICNRVDERPERSGNSNAVDGLDILLSEASTV